MQVGHMALWSSVLLRFIQQKRCPQLPSRAPSSPFILAWTLLARQAAVISLAPSIETETIAVAQNF